MTIVRTAKNTNYTAISNVILNDDRLSWSARGIAAYLLSKPDDWRVNYEHLVEAGPDGRRAVLSAMKELEKLRYLKRTRYQVEGGRWNREVTLYEEPRPPSDENAHPADPSPSDENAQSVTTCAPSVENAQSAETSPSVENAQSVNSRSPTDRLPTVGNRSVIPITEVGLTTVGSDLVNNLPSSNRDNDPKPTNGLVVGETRADHQCADGGVGGLVSASPDPVGSVGEGGAAAPQLPSQTDGVGKSGASAPDADELPESWLQELDPPYMEAAQALMDHADRMLTKKEFDFFWQASTHQADPGAIKWIVDTLIRDWPKVKNKRDVTGLMAARSKKVVEHRRRSAK